MKDFFSIPVFHENILGSRVKDGRRVGDINQSVIDDCVSFFLKKKENLGDMDTTGQVLIRTASHHDINGKFITAEKGVAMEPVSEWPALETAIVQHVTQYVNSISKYNQLKKGDTWVNSSWFNVFEHDDTYAWHDHNIYFISCAYYPTEGPGNMPIIFKSPIAGLINTWWPGSTFGHRGRWEQETHIYPKKGDLIIFPAWLEHTVNTPDHGFSKDPKLVSHSFGHDLHESTGTDLYRVSINCNFGLKEVLDGLPE